MVKGLSSYSVVLSFLLGSQPSCLLRVCNALYISRPRPKADIGGCTDLPTPASDIGRGWSRRTSGTSPSGGGFERHALESALHSLLVSNIIQLSNPRQS